MSSENWLTRTLNKLSPAKQIIVWVSCTLLLIPILFVIINPEGGSIVLTLSSFLFYEKVAKLFTGTGKWRTPTAFKTGLVGLTAFIATTGILWLLFLPICHWIEVQETINIRFLNNEIYYGLSLCYVGAVDIVTLGFGAFVAYLLIPILYLIYKLLALPFRLFQTRS